MLIRMLDEQAVHPRDISSWRLSMLGGAPVAPGLVRRAREQLGVAVTIGFGQTEASPYLTHTRPDDPNPRWMETVGPPLPGTHIRISEPATGKPLPVGVVGEICARGPGLMTGYFDDPRARRGRSTPTAGCTPGTWAAWTRTATCGCRAGSRT
jgi:fatty-acyl-CoA synthase